MRGYFNVPRDFWAEATAFKEEPFTEREAYLWLLNQAAWKDHHHRAGVVVVPLRRGQLVHSTRFLASAWAWSEPRVRRFLERMEAATLLYRKTDAGVNVITICNYEQIQHGGSQTDAPLFADRRKIGEEEQENKEPLRAKGAQVVPLKSKVSKDDPASLLAGVVGRELADDFAEVCELIDRPLTVERARTLAGVLRTFHHPFTAIENAIEVSNDYLIDPAEAPDEADLRASAMVQGRADG